MDRIESITYVPIEKKNIILSNQEISYSEFIELLELNNIKMSKIMFLKFMRDRRITIDEKGKFYNFPTAFSIEMGIMLLSSTTKENVQKYIPKITIEGQKYFIEKFHYMIEDKIPNDFSWYMNNDIRGNPTFDYFGNQGTSKSKIYAFRTGSSSRIKYIEDSMD
ncbi:hypothetical protein GJI76_07135 [Lactococcus lactis subsp. cremoris]|nr:hypothetical protein [Lactococcus cremoris]